MPQQRETTTNNLADIIQLIQIAHRSGTLTVERGEGAAFEEGTIIFINGQIMGAQIGPYTGTPALSRFATWTVCRFAFLVSSNPSMPSYPSSSNGHSSGSLPPVHPNGMSQPSSSITNPGMQRLPQTTSPQAPIALQKPYRIPTSGNVLGYMEQLGLTREHRRLYMLIDGQRTTHELFALMGKNPEKILELLRDLERSGLIMMHG
ncbi:DUF4388 domain-containing protein [Dictyobacter halimunensis]|uniref:DUF4388 domain-containing protein n=1 Tax=Dictyobacter halimunensis TaxID=3026934 RepID=UPI0030C75F38